MRSVSQPSMLLIAVFVAFAGLAGTASASMTFGDSATGLALTGDAADDAVEVHSEGSVVIAAVDDYHREGYDRLCSLDGGPVRSCNDG
jgi:hypothetical protein